MAEIQGISYLINKTNFYCIIYTLSWLQHWCHTSWFSNLWAVHKYIHWFQTHYIFSFAHHFPLTEEGQILFLVLDIYADFTLLIKEGIL